MAIHKKYFNDRFRDKGLVARLDKARRLIHETDIGIEEIEEVAGLMTCFGFSPEEVQRKKWSFYYEWLVSIEEEYMDWSKKGEIPDCVITKEFVAIGVKDFSRINRRHLLYHGDSDLVLETLSACHIKRKLIFADYTLNMMENKLLKRDLVKERLQLIHKVLTEDGVCLFYVPGAVNEAFREALGNIFAGKDSFVTHPKNNNGENFKEVNDFIYYLTLNVRETKKMYKSCIMSPMKDCMHTYLWDKNGFFEVTKQFNTKRTEPSILEARAVVEGKLKIEETHMYTLCGKIINEDTHETSIEVINDFDFEAYATGEIPFEDCWKASEEEYKEKGYITKRFSYKGGLDTRGCSKSLATMRKDIQKGIVRLIYLKDSYQYVTVKKRIKDTFRLDIINDYVKKHKVSIGSVFSFKHKTIRKQNDNKVIESSRNDAIGYYDEQMLKANGKPVDFENRRSATLYRNILDWLTGDDISVLDLTAGTGNFEKVLLELEDKTVDIIACEKDDVTYECLKKNMMKYTGGDIAEIGIVEVSEGETCVKDVYERNLGSMLISKMNSQGLSYVTRQYNDKEFKKLVNKHTMFDLYTTLDEGKKFYNDANRTKAVVDLKNISNWEDKNND